MKPILLLMDEFPMLGKMDVMQNAISTLRSKKVAFYIILQSIAQLDAIYGENVRKILMDNCQFKAILQVSDPDSQKYFSDMFGTGLYSKTSYSRSWNTESDGITYGTHTQKERELRIYPQEFAINDDILLQTPYGVFRAKKLPVTCIRPYYWMPVKANREMLFSSETECCFSAVSTMAYTGLMHIKTKLCQQEDIKK